MTTSPAIFWSGVVAILALAATATVEIQNEYFFYAAYIVFQYVVLASAWNILGGYAGYVNFGTAAFFGVGTYTAIVLMKAIEAPILLQILAAAAVSGVLGLVTGLLTVRLRGIFYSIATVAVAIILETVIINWRYVGGSTGVQILRPAVMAPFDSYTKMLFLLMTFLAVATVSIARYVETSWIGRGLRAVRDSEVAAECSGVPTLKLKLFACTVSGALMGAAGAPLALYQNYIEPASTFNLNYSISALSMAIIGGMSHWLGPVIGAILLGSIQQIVSATISNELNLLVAGVLLVLFVVIAPTGIVGLATTLARQKIKDRA
jgi:branched-chain amino acid transport system permease protein